MPLQFVNPTAMAFKILEEYQKAIKDRLDAVRCSTELRSKILGDLYSINDVYLSLNRPYKPDLSTFADFCDKRGLHTSLREMFPDFRKKHLYLHQALAIDSILAGRTTIISTGTGSGKTESFLLPMLDYCLKTRGNQGIKAVILYPMNALAGDQLRRIIDATQGQPITVECFVGSTSHERRARIISNPPDILITNYVMLDRLITKGKTRSMFERSAQTLRYLVVDEIHHYRGTKGANLCLLLRRLRSLCSDKKTLIQIGASATLRQGGGYYNDKDLGQIQSYVCSLFGQEAAENFSFITPIYDDDQSPNLIVDPLPSTDQIVGDPRVVEANPKGVRELASQLAGRSLPQIHPGRGLADPLFEFAKRNPFIQKMREELKKKAYTLDELVELFRNLYFDNHGSEPRSPKDMVYAYLSLVNELNRRYSSDSTSIPDALLDYRLHLILSDLGGCLTRCLLCGCYHDGLRTHCTYCNGLLFNVSKMRPNLCLARCNGKTLSPRIKSLAGDSRHSFAVLVQPVSEIETTADTQATSFTVQPNLEADDDDESYLLRPSQAQQGIIRVIWPSEEGWLQELELEPPRLYWQNVQRVVDALLIKSDTKITTKLLGFIDNREKASGIRFRLRDEIAERTLTSWASAQWQSSNSLPLVTAYGRLDKQAQHYLQDSADTQSMLREILRELPFWFTRMLTRLDEYDAWKIGIKADIVASLQKDEVALINEVFLPHGAIDRAPFDVLDTHRLKHFFLEKYRVETEYGVGLGSAKEPGYDVVSLGEQGRIYQHVIDRLGSSQIALLLTSLCTRGMLLRKQTRKGVVFYQLNPICLTLECVSVQANSLTSELPLALIECHSADNTSEERADFEEKFRKGEIQALICTPTLEMGIDIGDLSCVVMIGFPPSPANYAQRAGRAGRRSTLRSATMVVLSSSGNNHDHFYAADPRKMIDGTITPPQFTLANMRLLAAHAYAHMLAGDKNLRLLTSVTQFGQRVEQFISDDELDLHAELSIDYDPFAEYLRKDHRKLIGYIRDHEQGYRKGFFPDYGFRKDGISLIDPNKADLDKEDSEKGALTTREPEEAVRKLVPGRVVFCGGRPVRVDHEQPDDTYTEEIDSEGKPFRSYTRLVAETHDDMYIYEKRDSDTKYQVT